MRTKAEKIWLWIAFGVVLALLPLLVNLLMFHVDGKPATWPELGSHGELFLVAAAIAADGLGRLWVRGLVGGAGTLCLIGCIYVLVWSSIEFSLVAAKLQQNAPYAGTQVAWDSAGVFVAVFMTCLGVMLYTED
jgi:hypothetical protein